MLTLLESKDILSTRKISKREIWIQKRFILINLKSKKKLESKKKSNPGGEPKRPI